MNLQTANTAVNLASNVASIVPTVFKAIKKGSFEIKYFRVLPEEYNKEVKLAKEKKKMVILFLRLMKNIYLF